MAAHCPQTKINKDNDMCFLHEKTYNFSLRTLFIYVDAQIFDDMESVFSISTCIFIHIIQLYTVT